MKTIILQSSIADWSKPYFKRYKKQKYSFLQWTDGTIDNYQNMQLEIIMKPALEKLEKLFDDNESHLQKKSSLNTGGTIGSWWGVPNSVADIAEGIIKDAHAQYMLTRKPTTYEDIK